MTKINSESNRFTFKSESATIIANSPSYNQLI